MTNYNKLTDSEKKRIIHQMYVQNNKSFQQIASDLGTYANKIRRDAIKLDIPIRNKSEAQKNAIETGTHKHPTKGRSRSEATKNKIGQGVLKSWDDMTDIQIAQRKKKAKEQWENLSLDQKNNMINKANQAVRETSKKGSKLEKFILNSLIRDGYKVDFHKEQILSNTKLQIDMFLPLLNIAIEIDGPSHFLPVWGEDALQKNISYDNKKTGLILGRGCVLIRIKQLHDFSRTRASLLYDKLIVAIQNIEKNFPTIDNRTIEIGD